MNYKIKILWKSLTGEINTFSAIKKIVFTAIGYISSIFSFSVILYELFGYSYFKIELQKNWFWFILFGLTLSFIKNREKLSFSKSMQDDLKISVVVKSLFNVKANSYVIPTNSYFRTIMEEEYVSPNSVQGTFQKKYFKLNLKELDKKIAKSLDEQRIVGVDCTDKFGKVKKYPIGTVAKVNHKNMHFYFVAINDVNEYGKPDNQTYENVKTALEGLIKAINNIGHYDDLALPLLGTGRAAIKEATIGKVAKETIDCFADANEKISRKLIICIYPKDYFDDKADLKMISNYLEFKSKFNG